ncbi:hypothetical protein [Candidatus Vampirococcus lugosii]|uniref:Uncharacterized protein n=1 Tax=Candidatus Vampirococcus lugosii TaxID=2789015 RepID=A0ABS5QNH3_9BACT|nr:hypothetical protein [Candidatus Vampirococcus lugosii]MBS8122549.1 hypothetical protein [Candidatus Vampirococcus lugosii]
MAKKIIYKKKHNKKNNNFVILIAILIAFSALVSGIYMGKKSIDDIKNDDNDSNIDIYSGINNNNNNNNNTYNNYYIGDSVNMNGKITESKGMGRYLFSDIDENLNREILLRSDTQLLSKYMNENINIKGSVFDVNPGNYIINVNNIEINLDNDLDENESDKNNKIEYPTQFSYLKDGLYIDFMGTTGFDVKKNDGVISIEEFDSEYLTGDNSEYLTGNNSEYLTGDNSEYLTGDNIDTSILKISPFVCDESSSTKNCDNIKNILTMSFINRNGIEFYKFSEINQWIFFNEDNWGYYVNPRSEQDLIDISGYINIYDSEKLKQDITKNIKNICKNNNYVIEVVDQIEIKDLVGDTSASIIGKDKNLNKYECNININFGESLIIDLEQIKLINSKENVDNDSTEISSGSKNEENLQGENDGAGTYEVDNPDTQVFESNRGFNVELPSSMIYYAEVISDENLTINGLNCNYKINASVWQNQDYLETNPDIEIFLCQTELDGRTINQLIGSRNLIYKKGIVSEKNFLIRYREDYLDIANSIKIE